MYLVYFVVLCILFFIFESFLLLNIHTQWNFLNLIHIRVFSIQKKNWCKPEDVGVKLRSLVNSYIAISKF